MSLRMPLPVALFLSLFLHAALLASGLYGAPKKPLKSPPVLEIQLPDPRPEEAASQISTEAATPASETPAPTPTLVRGRQLQRSQAALAKHLLYPAEAVELGLEGEVVLLLMLDANGRIVSAEVASSSGHAILDRAALTAARQIASLPGNPRQTLLPVRFRLE